MLDNQYLSPGVPPDPYAKFTNDKEGEKKRRQWFADNIRYIAGFYDRKTFLQSESSTTAEYPLDRMEKCWRYVRGTQSVPKAYEHTTKTQQNVKLPTQYMPGQDTGAMIRFLNGTSKIIIENTKITVKAISQAAQNERTAKLEALRTKLSLRADFDEFEKMGVGYNPIGKKDKEFHNMEEAERWMNMDYQEESAIWGQKLANDAYYRNHMKEQLAVAALHVWSVGATGAHIYAYNGRTIIDRIDSDALIMDTADGFDELHRKDRFAGLIEWWDKSAFLARCHKQLTDTEIEEVKSCTSETVADTLTHYGSRMRAYRIGSNGLKISRVLVYWKGKRNLGWKEGTEDEWGHKPFFKTKPGEGDYYDECIYQGTLWGNKWLTDIGVAPNQVKDPYNPAESDLPIKVCTPGIIWGQLNSIVSTLHQIQDLADYYTNEVKKLVSRNVGKVVVFYANEFQGPHSPAAMLSDFESYGIHYLTKKKGETGFSDKNGEKLMDILDLTLDPNIRELAALRAEQRAIMESISNLSPLAMGSQQQYVSQGTQSQSISQSNISTVATMNCFLQHTEMVMQYATNVARIIHSLEDGAKAIPIAGSRGQDFLKETSKYSLEQFGCWIKVLDVIDDKGKERLLSIALGLVQAKMFSMVDYVEVEQASTYTEALQYFRMIAKRQERKEAEQQKFALAQQEIEAEKQRQMNEQAQQTKMATTEMQVGGKLQETEMKVSADMAKAGIQMEQQQVA